MRQAQSAGGRWRNRTTVWNAPASHNYSMLLGASFAAITILGAAALMLARVG